jgi:GTP-binding protein
MFVDKVKVEVAAGNGGRGIVSFRHEYTVAKGGPDGGDGGKGGDVVLVASRNQNTLAQFRYKKLLKAEDGQAGSDNKKHGRSAKVLTVEVPVGTSVLDLQNNIVADLVEDGQEVVIAKGGKGGFGNAHFTSSTRQIPRVAEKGEPGEKFNFIFELRMIADVGLIGLPNAGKSSLLAAISNAHPEIADYPFTTLVPNLGVVDVSGEALLVADIPGLIEGASQGKGLGDEFLRHVSRCSVLVHLIDINSNDIAADYKTIRDELKLYSPVLAKKPEVVAITKIETLDSELLQMQMDSLKTVLLAKTPVFAISAYAKKGLKELLFKLKQVVDSEKLKQQKIADKVPKLPVITLKETPETWVITKQDNAYIITGQKIERFAKMTDLSNDFGVMRIRDILKKMGVLRQLQKDGINPGDKIIIGQPPIGEIAY